MNSPVPFAAGLLRQWIVIITGMLAVVGLAVPAFAAIEVDFDQDEYVVSGPGDPIFIKIQIDADHNSPEFEAIVNGLFSFGTALNFNPTKAQFSAIDVPDALDYFGFTAGGFTHADPGFGGGKGNIDLSQPGLTPYADSLLLEVTLTNLATAVDSYPLSLDFFRTLGANEQLFLDGTGVVLDPQIQFGRAIVRVVPEPTTACIFAIALAAFNLLMRNLLSTRARTVVAPVMQTLAPQAMRDSK